MNPSFTISYGTSLALLQQFSLAAATFDESGRITFLSPAVKELFGQRIEHFCRVASELSLGVLREAGGGAKGANDVLSRDMPDGRYRLTAHALLTSTARPAAIVIVHAVRSLEIVPLNDDFGELSAREAEVASLIAGGSSTRDIAAMLGISAHTVRRHTERIFAKLGIHRRLQLVRLVRSMERWGEAPIGAHTASTASSAARNSSLSLASA